MFFVIPEYLCYHRKGVYGYTIMNSRLLYVISRSYLCSSRVGPYHVYVIRQRLLTDITRYTVNPTYVCLHIKIKFFLFL